MWAGQGAWAGGWQTGDTSGFTNSQGQVDWASLAKQWIAQRDPVAQEATNGEPPQPQPPPAPPMEPQPPPPPPPQNEHQYHDPSQHVMQAWYGMQQQQQQGGWGDAASWGTEQQEQPIVSESQTFDYGHGNNNSDFDYGNGPNYVSFDADAAPEESAYHERHNQRYDQGNYNDGYSWATGGPGGGSPYNGRHHRPYRGRGRSREDRLLPRPPAEPIVQEDSAGLDAQKRRLLPSWIRDGLEKMENEKRKKEDREKKAKELAEEKAKKEAEENEAEEKLRREAEERGEILPPRKSRFDDPADDEPTPAPEPKSPAHAHKRERVERSPTPEPQMSEEEKQMQLVKLNELSDKNFLKKFFLTSKCKEKNSAKSE